MTATLERLARVLGGRRQGLVRIRDSLSLLQACIAIAAVGLAHSASAWALLATVALTVLAMARPLPEQPRPSTRRLWTTLVVIALAGSALRAVAGGDVLVAGVDFLLLLIVQRLFQRQRSREHMQLLMLGAVLMVIAAVIDAELHYPLLFTLYLPTATLALLVNHLLSEGERLGKRVQFEVDRYGTRQLSRLARASLQVAGLAALAGLLTFLVFPRFGVGVFLRGNLYGSETAGFSERVSLGGFGTIRDDPTVVMHLEVLDGDPEASRLTWYLRGSAFAEYRAGSWRRSEAAEGEALVPSRGYHLLYEGGEAPGEVVAMPHRFGNVSGETLETRAIPGFAQADQTVRVLVTMEDLGTDLLFSAGRPLAFSLSPRGAIEARNRVVADVDDQIRVLDRQPGPIQYEVVARTGRPTRAELAAVGNPPRDPKLAVYTELDDGLSPEFRALAREITNGADTRLAKVEAVLAYLGQDYRYSLDQPRSPRVTRGEIDPVEGFVFDTRAGHCEYFATAMALLLREAGVPTRNVNGFHGARFNSLGDFYAVRQADAHSWVEVHFAQLGWVRFDPTPPGGRTAGGEVGWFPRLGELLDALRGAYLDYVIDYDLGKQLAVLERLGVERAGGGLQVDWRRFAPWLAGVGGLLVALALARRLLGGRRERPAPEVAIYRELITALQRRGHPRIASESPRAWAERLSRAGAAEAEGLARFAEHYEALRFGPQRPRRDQLDTLADLARAVLRPSPGPH